jgi:cell division protease FtsH
MCKRRNVKFKFEEPSRVLQAFLGAVPYLLIFALIYFMFFRQLRGMGGGGMLSFGKSRATRITSDKINKTFDDIAGIEEAKQEVYEIIEFLRSPDRFRALGGRLPRGVLLVGSPGTGKTLLAKAIAGEAKVPFFSISGSDFVEMFVGVGASRVRDLFEQAKNSSPCIIFLDEIDAVGRKRGTGFSGGHDEREQTLNAILVEMDGFDTNTDIIVIAATNRPDVLDNALLRPGRFDRRIYVDLPDLKGREEILKVHSRNVKLEDDIDLNKLARGTPGYSGADLENVINEAALLAASKDKNAVDMSDLEEARDKVRWGREKRSRVISDEDKKITAYHEAGHALATLLLDNVSPLHKVTIIPRGRAMGATMQLPEKDEYNHSKKKILSEIKVFLSGHAAEELFTGDITSGASNDIERATALVRAMVCDWGMSDALGLVHYGTRETTFSWDDSNIDRAVSEATAEKIDAEIRRIIDGCYAEIKNILDEKSDIMHNIAQGLIKYEVLDAEDVKRIVDGEGLEFLEGRVRADLNGNGADKDEGDSAGNEKEGGENADETSSEKQQVEPEGESAETDNIGADAPCPPESEVKEEAPSSDEDKTI